MHDKKKLRIAIFGATGFIGKRLTERLLEEGHSLQVLIREENSFFKEASALQKGIDIRIGDFACGDTVEACLRGADVCIHLVSSTLPQTSNADPSYDVKSNLVASIQMLELAKRCCVKKVIFSSSGGTVYGVPLYLPMDEEHPTFPICSYGITKLSIEKYLFMYEALYGIKSVILRISNPYGPGQRADRRQGAVAVFMEKIARNQPIQIWGKGDVVRDFVFIDDVIEAFCLAIQKREASGIFNIGSGDGLSINKVISCIEGVLARKAKMEYLDSRGFDVSSNVLSPLKAGSILGWKPSISFRQGIEKMKDEQYSNISSDNLNS